MISSAGGGQRAALDAQHAAVGARRAICEQRSNREPSHVRTPHGANRELLGLVGRSIPHSRDTIRATLLRPLRRAPMMLGGVGFQVGLDEARRERMKAQRRAAAPRPDVVEQLKELKALRDDGTLTPEEFLRAKRKVLGG